METIKYENISEALIDLKATDKGSYYIVNCPSCQKREAFIYKSNLNFINCSRQNSCGDKTYISLHKESEVSNLKFTDNTSPKVDIDTTELYKSLEYIKEYMNDDGIKDFRGFSKELQRELYISHIPLCNLANSSKDCFEKKYKTDYWKKRNIAIPIIDHNTKQVHRLLLRSTDLTIEPKEIQLTFKNNAKDFQEMLLDTSKHIFIAESVLDAFSFLEINNKVSVIGLTGAMRTTKLFEYIKNNIDYYKARTIVLALDNDAAGNKTKDKIIKFLDEHQIKHSQFDLGSYKDPNDYLKKNRIEFKKAMDNSIVNTNEKRSLTMKTTEEKNKEINESFEEIEKGVIKAFSSPKEYINLLNFTTSLTGYSFNNRVFLQSQIESDVIMSGNPPYVNTFNNWKKQNISVLKGAKALKIIQPGTYKTFERNGQFVSVKYANQNEKAGIENGTIATKDKTYYRAVKSVFHFTQTNADLSNLQENMLKHDLVNEEDIKSTYNNIVTNISNNGISVLERNMGVVNGKAIREDNGKFTIIINSNCTNTQKIKTLLHEIAHIELNHLGNKEINANQMEVEAETSAFLLCKEIGLDSSDYSFDYIASYSENKTTKELKDCFSKIEKQVTNIKNVYLKKNDKSLDKDIKNDLDIGDPSISNTSKKQSKGLDMSL